MQELMFLGLFVLALAIGWFLGRREAIKVGFMLKPHGSALDRQYFIGLNYLLNEQPDEAIETFIRALEVNPETVETHIAIGKLFCQRGDVERAIKVHQNLLARPNLTAPQADRVQLELARDYLAVGMHQRAERLLEELAGSSSSLRAEALVDLVTVYEQQHEWQRAIEIGRRLLREQPRFAVTLAHYYCEMAVAALAQRELNQARSWLEAALRVDDHCVRALILLAELEEHAGNQKALPALLHRIANNSPDFVPEVLALAERCADNGALNLADYLDQALGRANPPPVKILLARAQHMRRELGSEVAEQFLLKHLQQQPSLAGVLGLLKLGDEGASETVVSAPRRLLETLQRSRPQYRCEHCGFTGNKVYWQCPSCQGWSTVKPLRGHELT
ncbi:lipopolysaccharide assembly protein LapB [Halopseudomonas oceani]|uniref:lipopolysaccharide assembly protein LapB n=1 Tax=Halopseudomonas oceani TaxID=1708783 RepID=UPI002AA6C4BD|nr:lipopolysaccharide assembly protein LapB [Halopseudomonas oceani]